MMGRAVAVVRVNFFGFERLSESRGAQRALPSRPRLGYGLDAMSEGFSDKEGANTVTTRRVPSRLLRWAVPLAAASALLSVTLAAHASRVLGRVSGFEYLLNPVWQDAKNPNEHGYSFREPVPTVRADLRQLFPHIPKEVCVALLADSARRPQKPVLVRVGGGRTTPVTIVLAPGTRISFQNTDPFPHSLYGVGISTFTPSRTRSGDQREWTVPSAGVFEIRDKLAPSLRFWVVGEPNVAAIAYPSMKGEFALTVDEPGKYKVQTYFSGKPVGAPVDVEFKGNDMDLRNTPIKLADKQKDKG